MKFYVLCEDALQLRVAYRMVEALVGDTFDRRLLKGTTAPAGKGSGEQFVRDNYARYVALVRNRHDVLLILTDADNLTPPQRLLQLKQQLPILKPNVPDLPDNVFHFIPKWSIETWLLALEGKCKDENLTQKGTANANAAIGNMKKTVPLAVNKNRFTAQDFPNGEVPPSLQEAYRELNRLLKWLGKAEKQCELCANQTQA